MGTICLQHAWKNRATFVTTHNNTTVLHGSATVTASGGSSSTYRDANGYILDFHQTLQTFSAGFTIG
jgi:hypothetical protein